MKERDILRSARPRIGPSLATLGLVLALTPGAHAQVGTNYIFTQTGSGTYTPIGGGVVLASYTATSGVGSMDDVIYNLPAGTIPFTFTFDGVGYTGCNVSSNGFITFGATAPSSTTYNPISATTAYAGAISAFGRDLQGGFSFSATRTTGSNVLTGASSTTGLAVGQLVSGTGIATGSTITAIGAGTVTLSLNVTSAGTGIVSAGGSGNEIRYETLGIPGFRVFVVQWTGFKRFGSTATTVQDMFLNFQIRLYEVDNAVEVVYGNCSPGTGTTFTTVNAVGLRGPTNAFPANVNNRQNTKGVNDNWNASVAGTLNSSGMLFNAVAPANAIPSGLTYRWFDPPCTPPAANVSLSPINCATNQYTATVNITGLGDAPNVNIVSSIHGTIASGVGTGSYASNANALGTPESFTVVHTGNAICNLPLGPVVLNDGDNVCHAPSVYPIPDNGCAGLNFLDVGFCVTDPGTQLGTDVYVGSVEFIISHTWNDDLEIRLINPNGTVVDLVLDRFGSGDNLGNPALCPGGLFTLQDGGTPLSNTASSNVVGTFAPEQPLTTLHDGSDPNGSWTLRVCDDAGGDLGAVRFVRVNLVPCQAPTASQAIVPACGSDEFFVDVNVTSLGTSTSVDLTNSVDASVVTANATGVYQLGPFPSGSSVTVTLEHDNPICNVSLSPLSFTCPPPNDLCVNAIPVACNSLTLGTTVSAGNLDAPASCTTSLNTAGGVWYTVTGWGGQMIATTCNTATTFFDTKLAVFDGTGGCGALVCVAGNDDASPSGDPNCLLGGLNRFSKVTWTSTPGTTYYIYVTGFGTNTGNFGLEVACGEVDPACTDNSVTLEMTTDGAGAQVSHRITGLGLVTAVSSQNGYPNNTTTPVEACLPNGTYRLVVSDAGNNGITGGGYVLRDDNGNRIIDNAGNGDGFTSTSAMLSGFGFDLPVGPVTLYAPFCDKEDLSSTATIRCESYGPVSAQFGVTNATSGYQWRFFDPNGTYLRNIFISHANPSDPGKPAGAGRATWLRFQSIVTLPLPQNILLNVQVRPRVAGVNGNWGPVCRLVVDDVAAACPTTTLIQDVNNPNFSCGVQRVFGPYGNTIVAQPVLGANRYRFRFEQIGDAFVRNIAIPSYALTLNWGTLPLTPGASYNVFVQVSFDGGANYCPFGAPCVVDIISPPSASTRELDEVAGAVLNLWPNPNRGDQLYLTLSELPAEELTVNVDIHDLFGKRVAAHTVLAQGGTLNTVIALDGRLASGMYLVTINAGDRILTERLVIE